MPQADPFAKWAAPTAPAPTPTLAPNPEEEDPFAKWAVESTRPSTPPVGQRVDGNSFADKIGNAAKMLGQTVVGFGKGTASTAADVLEAGLNTGMIPGMMPRPTLLQPEFRHPAFTQAEEATTATNTPQMVGKGLETAAEILIPGTKLGKAAIEAIPSAARAGGKFREVMSAARQIPIDVNAPGEVALRISQLAERGGSMPMAVNKFLRRITDPEKAPMVYEEARDFASNISRLSANEFQRLTPVVQREVAGLRVALNKSVADAAVQAGKGKEYAEAMTEYAKSMKLQKVVDSFYEGAKKAAPWATGAGAAVWLSNHLKSLLPGGD